MINTTINNYQILEKIGEGGMGTVYRGIDLTLQRPVAIKILHAHLLSDPSTIERFCTEARTLANLNHQNLATLYNFVTYDQTFCMVMEYVEGRTLADLIQSEKEIGLDKALNYTSQILRGLNHAHQQGVIHRDVKPSNIIVTNDDQIKVMDFGIARIIGSQRFTRTGTMIGTLQYMAPEQIKGEEGGIEADLYAVGTVLYEMVSGKLPHQEETEYGMIQKKVSQKPVSLHLEIPQLSRDLSRRIMQSLEIDPAKRYHSANDFMAAIQLDIEPNKSDHQTITKNSIQTTRKAGYWKWLVAALVLLIMFVSYRSLGSRQIPADQDLTDIPVQNFEFPEMDSDKPLIIPAAHQGGSLTGLSPITGFNVDSLFDKARSLYHLHSWLEPVEENALSLCRQILRVSAQHQGASDLIREMAKFYEETGDSLSLDSLFEQAIEAYEKSLSCEYSVRVSEKKRQISGEKTIQVRIPQPQVKPTLIRATKPAKSPARKEVASEKSQEPKVEDSTETDTTGQESSTREAEQKQEQNNEARKTETTAKPEEKSKPTHVYVANGKEVTLILDETLSSGSCRPGKKVTFTLQKDIMAEGKTIIRKGQKATGEVTQIKSLRDNNKPVLEVQIHSIKSVNGKSIHFKANTFRIIGKRNQEAEILQGQIFEVRTDRDYTLTLP